MNDADDVSADWKQHIPRFGEISESLRAEAARHTDAPLKSIVTRLCEEVRHDFLELQQLAKQTEAANPPSTPTTWRDLVSHFGSVAEALEAEVEENKDGTSEETKRYVEEARDLSGQLLDIQRQLLELKLRSPEPVLLRIFGGPFGSLRRRWGRALRAAERAEAAAKRLEGEGDA